MSTQEHYDRMAEAYPAIRQRPVQAYTDTIEQALLVEHLGTAKRVLDLGCGEGRIARFLSKHGDHEVWASDYSPGMVQVARRIDAQSGVRYFVDDAQAMGVRSGFFDAVVTSTAMNNIPDLAQAFGEIRRALKPGGLLLTIVINSQEWARFARYVYWAPYFIARGLGVIKPSYYTKYYAREELLALAAPHFDVVEQRGVRMLPDLIPELPFNMWKPLFPLTRAIIELVRPMDEQLCSSAWSGSNARFHFLALRARP